VLVRAERDIDVAADTVDFEWGPYADSIQLIYVPGTHRHMIMEPYAEKVQRAPSLNRRSGCRYPSRRLTAG
jgi:thioesterase domain-containing protein